MNIDAKTLETAHQALNRAVGLHLRDPNVSLVDLGWRIRDSQGGRVDVGDLRVRVHVRQKYSDQTAARLESFAAQRLVSERAIGFPVDVPQANYKSHNWLWFPPSQPTPRPVMGNRYAAFSPMQGGISVAGAGMAFGHFGTLGGKVIDRKTREAMILSNWHVLVASWGMSPGSAVFQPNRGEPSDLVARLTRDGLGHHVDAAVATLTNSRRLENNQLGIGAVTGSDQAQFEMRVIKSGVRTGVTNGVITGTDGRLSYRYNGIPIVIRGVVHIASLDGQDQLISNGGDSGSWWLDQDSRKAVALHFAGDATSERKYALAINMPLVLDTLGVDVALA